MINKFVVVAIIVLFAVSCSTTKGTTDTNTKEMKTSALIKKITDSQPNFNYLTIQSKINTEIDGTRLGLNGKIFIENGKMIWVNISKFGLNAARALITPDGVKAYEKLNRTYIDSDFSYFNELLKVNFIDYDELQNLLLGRIFVDLKADDFSAEIVNGDYILQHKENDQIVKNLEEGKYFQRYIFDSDFRLKQAFILDPNTTMELLINYENWTKVGSQEFPQYVKVLVKETKTQKVDIEYNNFTFQQSQTPFEIPSGYKPNKLIK